MSSDSLLQNKIRSACTSITNQVRSSSLNFSIQETPFSLYLTVRKSISKSSQIASPRSNSPSEEPEKVVKDLKTKSDSLEKENNELKASLEETLIVSEEQSKYHEGLESKIQILHEKLAKAEAQANRVTKDEVNTEAIRSLQVKHEKICSDLKITKAENNNLKKDLDIKSVAIKAANKDAKDAAKAHDKELKKLETELKNLLEYRISKSSEEKDLKQKIKKTDKKLKNLQEREAKLVLEKSVFEKSKAKTEVLLQGVSLEQEAKDRKVEKILAEKEAIENETFDENSNTYKSSIQASVPNPVIFLKIVEEKEFIDKKVACFVESIHEFMHIEPDDEPDSTVVKLEALKELLKDEKDMERFDDLIEEAKAAIIFKKASEDITKTIESFDENEVYGDYEDFIEELPDYYWTEEYQNYDYS